MPRAAGAFGRQWSANVEAAFGGLDLVWLSTSAGDDNVFLLQASDLPG